MAYDVHHALEHAEVAGWAMGVLDPGDARAFEEHLRVCGDCQEAVAEFEPVVRGLARAAPAVEPPDYLEARTITAVQRAVMPSRRPDAGPGKASRWWRLHWPNPLLPVVTALAAAAVTAAAFVSVQVFQLTAPAVAAMVDLQAQPGFSGSGTAIARHTSGGWQIRLTVEHLRTLPPGQFYECRYAGPPNSSGHPELITAGTFVVGRSGSGTFSMWSAADPAKFTIMQITIEQPGDTGLHDTIILSGVART